MLVSSTEIAVAAMGMGPSLGCSDASACLVGDTQAAFLSHKVLVPLMDMANGIKLELYEHLVSAQRQRHGDRHPLTLRAIGGLATVAADRGEFAMAEGLAREAVAGTKETLGDFHPDSVRWLLDLSGEDAWLLSQRARADVHATDQAGRTPLHDCV